MHYDIRLCHVYGVYYVIWAVLFYMGFTVFYMGRCRVYGVSYFIWGVVCYIGFHFICGVLFYMGWIVLCDVLLYMGVVCHMVCGILDGCCISHVV